MLEVAYEFETYGTRALSITPLIFFWAMGTSLLGLGVGLRRTSRGSTSGILFSTTIFIGAGLILYLVLGLFLPNNAITHATYWRNGDSFSIFCWAWSASSGTKRRKAGLVVNFS